MKKQKKSKRQRWLALPVLALAIWFIIQYSTDKHTANSMKEALQTLPLNFTRLGIDLSHHNGKIDWEELSKASHGDSLVGFCFVKLTEGTHFVDPLKEHHIVGAIESNIPIGGYHFFLPKKSAKLQAKHFLKEYKKHKFNLPPVLDVEKLSFSRKELLDSINVWIRLVEKEATSPVIVYTSYSIFMNHFKNEGFDNPFWIASYSRPPDFTLDSRIIYWQYSDKGKLPGCHSSVDLNVFRDDEIKVLR